MRLDLFLLKKGLVQSRTQAQDLIAKGHIYILDHEKRTTLTKSSYEVTEQWFDKIFIEANELLRFVSRAGLKLDKAIERIELDVENKSVLDVGQSTGGFTDCLLQRGVARVVGVDVGHGQLHTKIQQDERVIFFENLNVKNLIEDVDFIRTVPQEKFNLIVADVSFISITKVIPSLSAFLSKQGHYLMLVKPQFECGADQLDKNGIVRDESVYEQVRSSVTEFCRVHLGRVIQYFESELPGKDGNREFFIYGQK